MSSCDNLEVDADPDLLLRQLNMSGFVIPAEAGIQGELDAGSSPA